MDGPNCSWSLARQTCVQNGTTGTDGNPAVGSGGSCPRFTVHYGAVNDGTGRNAPNSLVVRIADDANGLRAYLANSSIACLVDTYTYDTCSMVSDRIVCELIEPAGVAANRLPTSNPLAILYFSIVVNGDVRLAFDDDREHYVAVYGWQCENNDCAVGYWENGPAKYYCKWCTDNALCPVRGQQGRCDVRDKTTNLPSNGGGVVDVKSAQVKIVKFEPSVGLWTGGQEVRVTVKHHRILSERRTTTVTVAGRRCVHPRPVADDTIVCLISPVERMELADGPVQVEYTGNDDGYDDESNNHTVFRLTSDRTFRFVQPRLTGFGPRCGPVGGGTMLNVSGDFSAVAVDDDVRVTVGKNATCVIVARTEDRLDCVTSASSTGGPESAQVRVTFRGGLTIVLSDGGTTFNYAAEPYVDAGQTFAGIASGGVQLSVRGRFACVENPRIYLGSDDKNGRQCRKIDDSTIVCQTPAMQSDDPSSATTLPLRFRADFCGRTSVDMTSAGRSDRYRLLPYPVYENFEVDGTTVSINGARFMSASDYQTEDLTINLQRSSLSSPNDRSLCIVRTVSDNVIVCHTATPMSDSDVQQVQVAFGSYLANVVNKKGDQESGRLLKLVGVLSGVACLSLFVTLAIGFLFCVRTILVNSKQKTEERYVMELQNITAQTEERKL